MYPIFSFSCNVVNIPYYITNAVNKRYYEHWKSTSRYRYFHSGYTIIVMNISSGY